MYLLWFNVLSSLGWALVLVLTIVGIATNPTTQHYVAANTLSSQLGSLLARFVPPTYAHNWSVLAPVQSLAAFELVHVVFGLVRSPFQTTFIQVSSRLILIWAIVTPFSSSTHLSPIYTTMVLAWSLTEVIRYPYYAFGLLGILPPPWLTWLRYSTFYVLYPFGAGSEALVALSTISEWKNGRYTNWALEDWLKAAMVFIWIPGLYVMYTHMIRTRRKVLGPQKPQNLGAVPKDRLKTN